MKMKTKCSSCPNINRETTSYTNFLTVVHDDDPILNKRPKTDHDSSHDDNDTILNKRRKIDRDSSDAEASETNENYKTIDAQGDQKDQTLPKWPPSTSGSDANNDSVGSSQFSGGGGGERQFELVLIAGGREVKANRCILSERSPFFKNLLCGEERRVRLDLKDFAKDFDVSFDALVPVLAYLYSGKVSSLRPEGAHVCADDECEHVACRPVVDFLVGVVYASFVFQIPELVARYQRHLLDILDKIAADDILVVLSLANICGKECDGLLTRCIENIVRSDVDIITLDRTLPGHIVNRIVDSRKELGFYGPESSGFPDKHVKRLRRALDSHDVELVRMLVKEEHTSIDDACALHYAVAYCDAKIIMGILDLAIADVNHKSPRGYTVLHIAAMRKEPKIIVSLLTKGAQPAALTSDGRKALTISKRLTRAADYNKSIEQGKASPKDRLCIEILEQAERRDPLVGEASASHAKAEDDLRMKESYLEGRVALAKLLFPTEANVAMDVAQVDGTSEHLSRIRALAKTVELGKRFFPRCSEVINDMVDHDDLSELLYVQNGTREERQLKKRRYMEIQEAFAKAFHEDKEELDKSINIPSSSRPLRGVGRPNGKEELDKSINISSSSRPVRGVGRLNSKLPLKK
ncbi:BTB/POZ domain and ankyrin repeat-containing protein NPR1-like [Rhododendron vialii]|uniref:BTB/POZ domain and ankyrin repeat-containing protein NPR1-like n=1 Tax=Rhododendron vialii TaxID=182163 RepID=UPI00266005E0|nr:BTB/POZ domain and ankyrin repeat-containing protein NPR1-like [Rhododendron vialii]